MRRRVFLAAASTALFARPDIIGATELGGNSPVPSRLGATDVAALRDMATQLRAVAHTHGSYGGLLGPVVTGAERLLDVPAADDTHQDLMAVTGELHHMAGWLAFDMGGQEACRAHLGRSMELCSAGGDTYGAAWAVILAGVQADECGHLDDALRLLELARGKLATLPDNDDDPRAILKPRVREDMARVLVGVGDDARGRYELAAARDTPPDTNTGGGRAYRSALMERARGDLDAAEQHAEHAARVNGNGPSERPPLFSRIILADLRVAAGEPSGAALSEQVIREVDGVRSARMRNWLSRLVVTLDVRGQHELAEQGRRVVAGV